MMSPFTSNHDMATLNAPTTLGELEELLSADDKVKVAGQIYMLLECFPQDSNF